MAKRKRTIQEIDGVKYETIYYDQKLDGKMKLGHKKKKKKAKKHYRKKKK
jgi:hypothetical protein